MNIVRVGLDVPLDRLFDYRCDDASAAVGERVLVPFGKRSVVGVIIELANTSEVLPARLKAVKRVLRDSPGLSSDDLRLLHFAADYYHHPLGAVVMNALPGRMRRERVTRAAAPAWFALTALGATASVDMLPARANLQRRLFERFVCERSLSAAEVREAGATATAALKALIARGWVVAADQPPPAPAESIPGQAASGPRPLLNAEQAAAVEAITAQLDRFHPHLLLGVTGSGKTEVYLRIIESVLARDRQALLLVPEIGLTPQLEGTVRERFPTTPIVSLHSGLNEAERHQRWLAAQAGTARIVLGTRLAVFTPLPDAGIIIVDEEHDSSYKQMEGLRYSARDLAVVRARGSGIPIVLGSATPMLETYYNATSGRYALWRIAHRVSAPAPEIRCINIRDAQLSDGLAPALLAALRRRISAGEQSLIFINRRGYAPVLMCRACGWLSDCHRCSAQLVYHIADRQMHCHHCGHQSAVPAACPGCGNADLTPVGQGTQRVTAALQREFPDARILRIDRDSTRKRDAWHDARTRIHAREVDVLVGTQMLAKGHDFPNLNLVGVLNADGLLYSTDFRAPERLYSLLTQVAGRAGRGAVRGEVLIQTDFPDHPLYAALREQDYPSFAKALLDERRTAGLPPFVHQALLRAEAPKLSVTLRYLENAARLGHDIGGGVTIYDPVPAGMMRVAGRERGQLLVQANSRSQLHAFLSAWLARLATDRSTRARWSLDVDPLEL